MAKRSDIDYDPSRHGIFHAKGILDGCTTLAEAASRAQEFADELESMESAGWQLTGPVIDDYGYVVKADG